MDDRERPAAIRSATAAACYNALSTIAIDKGVELILAGCDDIGIDSRAGNGIGVHRGEAPHDRDAPLRLCVQLTLIPTTNCTSREPVGICARLQ